MFLHRPIPALRPGVRYHSAKLRSFMCHTDCDGLDLDALLDVGGAWVVGLLMGEDGLAAERVYESGSACRTTGNGQLRRIGDEATSVWLESDIPVPEAPQTIRQN